MKNVLYILPLLLISCGQTIAPKVYQVNVAFETYVETFRREAKVRGQDFTNTSLIAQFDTDTNNTNPLGETLGECLMGSNPPQITVYSDWWNSSEATENLKLTLIVHELTHCWLNRIHRPGQMTNGIISLYISLMNPYIQQCNIDHLTNYYWSEIFNQNTELPEGWILQ
jgi:hypothetical protein